MTGLDCRNRHTCLGWRWPARCARWAKAFAGFEVGGPVVTLQANSGTGGYAAIFVSDAAYVASMKDVSLPGHKDLARPAATAAIIAAAAGLAQAHVETLPLASAAVVRERLENHSVNGRLVLRP